MAAAWPKPSLVGRDGKDHALVGQHSAARLVGFSTVVCAAQEALSCAVERRLGRPCDVFHGLGLVLFADAEGLLEHSQRLESFRLGSAFSCDFGIATAFAVTSLAM